MAQNVGSQTPLVFKVTKQKPELIAPAKPTPYEFKELSVVDDQQDLRYLEPGIQFYKSSPRPCGPDPAKVIKEALGKVLVAYYPLAGRLRDKEDGKLVVECNGDGILFVEADAVVTLADFGEPLFPPFPCMEELLYDFSNHDAFMDYPLLLIQVTRLKCGGFIFAHKTNHAVADATGLAQFMHAVAEVARGAEFPSVHPVWRHYLLRARDPPQVTHEHPEYDDVDDTYDTVIPFDDVVYKSFFFGPIEIANMRCLLPAHLKSSTTFEILTACIWRSRTIAMQLNPNDQVRIRFFVNARTKFNPTLPTGYYGNALATPVAISTANNLASNPLGYALELIKSAKGSITEEYMKSLVDFLEIKGRPQFHRGPGSYAVSDVSRVGLEKWDFGWGNAVFGGPTRFWFSGPTPGFGNYFLAGKNGMGQGGIMVPMYLPRLAMDRFVEELNGYLSGVVLEQPVSNSGS